MRILLINPPTDNIITSEIPDIVREDITQFPPLGLMYLKAYIFSELKIKPKILDLKVEPLTKKELIKFIKNFGPDLVGLTAFTHNLIDVINILRLVKNVEKDIHTVIGGPHARNFPLQAIRLPEVDYVITGEGEIAFVELIKALRDEKEPKVKGLYYKEDNEVKSHTGENIINNINILPFPDREEIPYRRYTSLLDKNQVMTTLVTSRGCPYNCKFCDSGNIPFRLRSPENVLEELEQCEKLDIKHIYFLDDTFNVDYERVGQICKGIINKNFNFSWSCRAVVKNMDRELLTLMKKAGCKRIHFGVETSTDAGLKILGKDTNIPEIKKIFLLTKQVGIESIAYFMIGCPHEKEVLDIKDTINFAILLDPDYALFNILMPYPNTEIFKLGVKKGILNQNRWQEFAQSPDSSFIPEFWEEYFKRGDLFSFLHQAYRKFYFRPSKGIQGILKISSISDLFRYVKLASNLLVQKR